MARKADQYGVRSSSVRSRQRSRVWEGYYESLHEALRGWYEGSHSLLPWWDRLPGVVLRKASQDLEARVAAVSSVRDAKREMIREALDRKVKVRLVDPDSGSLVEIDGKVSLARKEADVDATSKLNPRDERGRVQKNGNPLFRRILRRAVLRASIARGHAGKTGRRNYRVGRLHPYAC